MKNQISFLTCFSIILLLCMALWPDACSAHKYKTKTKTHKAKTAEAYGPSAEAYGPSAEAPFVYLPPETSHNENPTSYGDDHSYTSFSMAFADILKGSVRGHRKIQPDKNLKINHQSVKDICSHTDYPDVCGSSIAEFMIRHKNKNKNKNQQFDLMNILEAAIKACTFETNYTIAVVAKHMHASPELAALLSDCKEQYASAIENLRKALDAIAAQDIGTVTVRLSAVMADVTACESGFGDQKVALPKGHAEGMVTITASNCLAIASMIPH